MLIRFGKQKELRKSDYHVVSQQVFSCVNSNESTDTMLAKANKGTLKEKSMKESAENYLETILLLQRDNETVRAIDVANALGYSKPSVSRAMGILKAEGMLESEDGNCLTLTKEGLKKAKALLDRHETITTFLMMTADVSQEIAEEDACKMEHFLNEKTFKGIKKFVKEVGEYNQ